MPTQETLERKFLQAVNPKTGDLTLAHAVIDEMRLSNACDAYIALHDAHLLDLEHASRKADALAIVMERCVRCIDVEPALQARCLVKATKLAMHLNERAIMRELRGVAATLFARHSADREVTHWLAGVELNVGLHLYYNRDYDEALRQFDSMIVHFAGDREYECWLTGAYAHRAMIFASMRCFDEATTSLNEAKRLSTYSYDQPVFRHAEAEIHAYSGDTTTALALFWQAYKAASALTPRITRIMEMALMRYAQLTRLIDEQSCELACALLHEITGNNGMPHVRDARQTLTASIPNNRSRR